MLLFHTHKADSTDFLCDEHRCFFFCALTQGLDEYSDFKVIENNNFLQTCLIA
ncbi:hypothetical protein SynROS8604_01054 [Synechococcus sp. ROS8604]|nr:hypothetical protein SynROS8604_01054 [Synechococcus sp. ROS8604]